MPGLLAKDAFMRPTTPLLSRDGATSIASDSSLLLGAPHSVEREVHRRLSTHPGVRLQSLVVHKTPAGVCLEGRVELLEPAFDVQAMLSDIDGVDEVINHLMPSSPSFTLEASHALFDDEDTWPGYHHG
jgi:hypothetical protein